ncbi:rho guanine nucleotide exchange factor 40-like isoform X2 [Sphaerodactylus townsendi]|uniref:rho guanine nucleotide exchange factor 40-like isoform X2 n=1 Tax=Sphaerodactylus townsendi TaxID=933632 RepID=UPI002027406C|nr:rho guanine nucleotide exchange factor 40-like isoform X2 [Sphaerodactylus townsendi]
MALPGGCSGVGGRRLQEWEPEPVEECVQSTLAALYPPFEATAPTLLSQVFEVLERTYQHDALRYTLDFLVPAKHILARVQSEACAQYSGFVFCHEGWPLCLREKVLVQLGSLPWQRLCPGDFYLQVVPHRECAPRLVLKCLSPEGRGIQELPIPPDSYPFLFTVEWLNGINKERRVGRLERCLLADGEKVLSFPWPELVYPQFVHKDGFIVGQRCPADLEVLGARSPGDGRHSGGESRESEGEYVHLLEVSPTLHQGPRIPETCGAQIQTMPARKGHHKNRSRRHRAWLHHKSGCGENFALRKVCKNQEAEQCSQERSGPKDRTELHKSNPTQALDQTSKPSQVVENPGSRQLGPNQESSGGDARPNISGAASAEGSGLEKVELPGSVNRDPTPSREVCHENPSPASVTPRRTAKGNRRRKKGVGRGAGGRIRPGCDTANQETGVSTDLTVSEKEGICVGTGKEDAGKGEESFGSGEQAASPEECCAGIADCNGTGEISGITGDETPGAKEEGVGINELAIGAGKCSIGTKEPKDSTEKCSAGTGDGTVGTGERSVGREGPDFDAKDQTAAVGAGEASPGMEEQSVMEQKAGTDGDRVGEEGLKAGLEEAASNKLPGEEEPSVDGQEEAPSIPAELAVEETQPASLPAEVPLQQAIDWDLLRSGVFALTGGMDRAGRPLLTVVPQFVRDGLPPGQEVLVNTLRYLHSLLRKEQKAVGVTVLLDLSQVDDWALQAPVLLPALRMFQEGSPPPVSRLLVILPPDDRFVPHEEELALEPAVEVVVLSLPELPHYAAQDQLIPALGGTLHYSPHKWVGVHQALEQLRALCCSVLKAVCEANARLQAVGTAASQQEPSAQIASHQEMMQKLLSEPQLLELQRHGGALLAQLPTLGPHSTETAAITKLYQEVDEALHSLVQLSNQRLEALQQEREKSQAQHQTVEEKTRLPAIGNSMEERRSTERVAEGASLERMLLLSPRFQGKTPEASPSPRPRACSISTSSSPKHGWGLSGRFGSSCSLTSLFQPHSSPKPSPCCSPTRSNPADISKKKGGSPANSHLFMSPPSPLALHGLSDPGRPSVHIRGLEVSSRELADRSCSPREHVLLSRSGTHVAEAPWGATPRTERRRCLGVQQQLLAEMLECEREYASALAQPVSLAQEPGRQALPVELRCIGSALRATRDQLAAFHSSNLLGELEGCMNHPSRAGSCFLRHGEKFQLYAIYAKDHYKFQAALASLRTTSKKGPTEPREHRHVAHVLREPLEQLERYRRFLGELLRECDLERGPDRQALQEAQQLLEAPEQQGRDLLAAEQIRGCEMKLSEQGPLLQCGELTLVCGRRKCQRHVFLFERLLLFTKCKGAEGGYVCKQALQTACMGLTESVGPSGLRFELWFGRGPARQAYTLQAASPEVKHQWTNVIAQLLWRQAAHPAVSMCISSCPAQRLAPLGLGPGPPSGLSLPGHVEEEEWDLDVKPIPRETSDSEGPSPSHREPSGLARSLPGSSSAVGHHQSRWVWSLHRKLFSPVSHGRQDSVPRGSGNRTV